MRHLNSIFQAHVTLMNATLAPWPIEMVSITIQTQGSKLSYKQSMKMIPIHMQMSSKKTAALLESNSVMLAWSRLALRIRMLQKPNWLCLTWMSASWGQSRPSNILMVPHQFMGMMISKKLWTQRSILLVTNAVQKVVMAENTLASWLPVPIEMWLPALRPIQLILVITVLNPTLIQSASNFQLKRMRATPLFLLPSLKAMNIQKTKSQIMHAVNQL